MGLHTRGNLEGWRRAGSKRKWLEVHGDTHFTHFYSRYGEGLQKRFFGHFLKGENTGWDKQPPVALNVRHPGEKFVWRAENEWPLQTDAVDAFLSKSGRSAPRHRRAAERGYLELPHGGRRLDPVRSTPYRPWHTHDEEWPLDPGQPVELDIEIWPTSIVAPVGYRLALTVRGKDYEVDGKDAALPNAPYPMKGVGPFVHVDPDDRPPHIFMCRNTLYFAPGKQPYLLLPIISEA
jgi:predicted acyl esterase